MALRVVVMTFFHPAYRVVADWAERHGHRIVLVVTPPVGRSLRGANPLVLDLPPDADVLLTGRLRPIATPAITALAPDLVVSVAYPRLIPPEIIAVPTCGAFNVHPSLLPEGRGPNPQRAVYEGATTIGATTHRIAPEFDTGAIMSQREATLPEELTAVTFLAGWLDLMAQTLEEGVASALAGEPGRPQDAERATEARPFTIEEKLLDLTEPASVLVRKAAALNVMGPEAKVRVDGTEATVLAVRPAPGQATAPGTILDKHEDGWTVQTGTDALRIVTVVALHGQ
ncbi:methionyl-tRNA formyltransferase [Tenggerimyces flavus]|uniref:Methionyl-tRNA formyltransferase n=1 Tax=Tenggerimyces flavus TaxID=1708749 RepID=A0ABV7YJ66_9ACTN|nr:formyltransferase family protein [Tenggerimyces flavus]MBM7783902.1 methionyl-tRNA formyltransferase [Tenggerimyces flavus]